MKPIDELIEEEVEKIFGTIKKRLNDALSNAIRSTSLKVHTYLTEENEKEKDSEIFQFIQCEKCKRFHFENENHVCNALRGNENA